MNSGIVQRASTLCLTLHRSWLTGLVGSSGTQYCSPLWRSYNRSAAFSTQICYEEVAKRGGTQEAAASVSGGGLGNPLPALERTGCVYLDYNATTPVWPEVCCWDICMGATVAWKHCIPGTYGRQGRYVRLGMPRYSSTACA